MDRFTDNRFASEGFYQPKSREERLEIFANIPSLEAIYKRLAEYEETGLTPEQITAFKNMPRTDIRLISAQDIETSITERCTDCESNNCQDCIISEMQIKIWAAPTIEAQPVNTDKCKALRNIEGIRLILSNVYNTGSTLQDCDYDAIFKRLDVIENILKGE